MKLFHRLFLVIGLMVSVLLAGHAEVRASQRPSLPMLSLQPGEVPPGFHRDEARVFTDRDAAQVDGVTLPVIKKLGRITGFETGYSRTTRSGMCCITSQVSLWRNSHAAREAYDWHVALGQRIDKHYPGFQQLTFWHGRLSMQAFLCSCPGGTQGILNLRTYKGSYYVFTQVEFLVRNAHIQKIAAQAMHDIQVVMSRVPCCVPQSIAPVR